MWSNKNPKQIKKTVYIKDGTVVVGHADKRYRTVYEASYDNVWSDDNRTPDYVYVNTTDGITVIPRSEVFRITYKVEE